jgi:hypothetical protein
VVTLLLLLTVTVSLASRSRHTFEVPNDPSVRVLEVETSGGMRMESTRYELYGDGRLVGLSVSSYASGAPQLIFTEQLLLAEYDTLIADLFDSGLMEFDTDELRERFASRALPTDEVNTTFTLRLHSYDGRPASAGAFLEHRFSIFAARVRAQQFPDVRELAAVGRLLTRIDAIHRKHLRKVR